MPEDADLHADPAFGVDVPGRGGHPVRTPVEPFWRAERAAGPQDRDELDDLASHRVPDQMARASFGEQSLRGGLNGHSARRGPQRQPDRARRTPLKLTPVGFRPDAPCSRHPCVWHRIPSQVRGLDLAVPDFSHLLTPLAAISPEGECLIMREAICNPEEISAVDPGRRDEFWRQAVRARAAERPGWFLANREERPGAPLSPGLIMKDGCQAEPVHQPPATFADLLQTSASTQVRGRSAAGQRPVRPKPGPAT
jgi:hypothetical protein